MRERPGIRWNAAAVLCAALFGAGALVGLVAGDVALPEAAKKTAERFGNGGKIEKVAKESEDGLGVYTIVLNKDGRTMEVQTTLAGDLNATEEVIAAGELPDQVAKTAHGLFPKGVLSAERAVVVLYEVKGRDASGSEREVRITLPGVALYEHAAPPPVKGKNGNEGKK